MYRSKPAIDIFLAVIDVDTELGHVERRFPTLCSSVFDRVILLRSNHISHSFLCLPDVHVVVRLTLTTPRVSWAKNGKLGRQDRLQPSKACEIGTDTASYRVLTIDVHGVATRVDAEFCAA